MPRIRPDRDHLAPGGEFSAFGDVAGSDSTLFRVDDEAQAYLARLADTFPKEFARALRHVGWRIQQQLKRTIRQESGAPGTRWQPLSRMHIFRRMDQLKAGYADAETGRWTHGKRWGLKRLRSGAPDGAGGVTTMERDSRGRYTRGVRAARGGHSIPDAFNRWRGSNSFTRGRSSMGGRLQNALRYRYFDDQQRVQIGTLTRSAGAFLGAVQGGRRGSRGVFQFEGEQPVTPAMRRAFWAAGVPLAKDKRNIEQPERPLVGPVYRVVQPEIGPIIEQRILDILQGKTGRRA